MKTTLACNCGSWVWHNGMRAWGDGHGWEWGGAGCGICGEELAEKPEGVADVPEQRVITLTVCGGGTYEYRSITSITGGHPNTQVIGVCRCPDRDRWHDTGAPASIIESPAEITRLARAVWGTDDEPWSCKGADPPMVVLHVFNEALPVRFSSITNIQPYGCSFIVEGTKPDGSPIYTSCVNEDGETVRALCAEQGVPCCVGYPAAWKPSAATNSFTAYGCSVSIDKHGDGWGFSVSDLSHSAHTDGGGLLKKDAIETADMLAKAWGNEKQWEG